jgi:peptidoglycan/LPS O-acetylase OafA/YrhL
MTMTQPDAFSQKRIHISHLDGLRGLAALYVVLCHAYQGTHLPEHGGGVPSWLNHLLEVISFARLSVAVFIVLSGYCLMMPVVQHADSALRGGLLKYLKRRAKRILPPYYAAGLISLLLIAFVPGMGTIRNVGWDDSLPAFHWDILVSHLFLIHNLSENWSHKIDYPMWSVATEWQIYFIFPLLLLLWRRFGLLAAVGTAFAAGLAPHWLFQGRVDGASFVFIGLFALGMAGAVLSFSARHKIINFLRTRLPWGVLTLVMLAPVAYFAKFRGNLDWSHVVLNNIAMGLATMCVLVYCAQSLWASKRDTPKPKASPLIVKLLQSRPFVALGSFSYSLYLIHAPVLALVALGTARFSVSASVAIALSLFVAVPVSIIAAYLFFLAFERPFLVKRLGETPAEAARDAALSPAP